LHSAGVVETHEALPPELELSLDFELELALFEREDRPCVLEASSSCSVP
jgi:hypothetical protein